MVALSAAQSLAYLDIAVLWALWNELGLRTLLARVLPHDRQEVSSADVVFALVAQRCLGAGLEALGHERWGADYGAAGVHGRCARLAQQRPHPSRAGSAGRGGRAPASGAGSATVTVIRSAGLSLQGIAPQLPILWSLLAFVVGVGDLFVPTGSESCIYGPLLSPWIPWTSYSSWSTSAVLPGRRVSPPGVRHPSPRPSTGSTLARC